MTIRALAAVLSLSALTPLAAHADAPSGEYFTLFAPAPSAAVVVPSTRAEHRNYVEFTVDELVGPQRGATPTVADIRRAVAAEPLPHVDA